MTSTMKEDSDPRTIRFLSRREALQTFGASAVALAAAFVGASAHAADAGAPAGATSAPAAPPGPFTLPPLPYDLDALEPHIDRQTMEIHHSRHHAAYVANANRALADEPALATKSAEAILRDFSHVPGPLRSAVRNNVGGHANHSLFWDILSPGGAKTPGGSLARKIESDLGGFDKFIPQLSEHALSRFGSGWAWLTVYNRKLSIYSTANQDSPLMDGATPILGIDVWEHAYYLKYQNRRSDYVKAVLNLINWAKVAQRLDAAMG
jgi:Fe-Mn family superoxide dismutase